MTDAQTLIDDWTNAEPEPERRGAEQTIHDPTPAGPDCKRCEDTRKVGQLARAAPLFMDRMGGPMHVTRGKAIRLIAEFCRDDDSAMAVLLAPVTRNITSTACPDCTTTRRR